MNALLVLEHQVKSNRDVGLKDVLKCFKGYNFDKPNSVQNGKNSIPFSIIGSTTMNTNTLMAKGKFNFYVKITNDML